MQSLPEPYYQVLHVSKALQRVRATLLMAGDLVSKETVCCVGGKVKH